MKVIIIGAGIAGPVLGMLLKHKGFDPVIYERLPSPPKGGLTMILSGQVQKVLNILGLAQEFQTLVRPLERLLHVSTITNQTLLDSPVYSLIREQTGWPMCATVRATYLQWLADKCSERGVPIRWGKKLVDVVQLEEEGRVRAVFEDGTTDEGELLVGADGLQSRVRDVVFGKDKAEYSGVTTIGGVTPMSDELLALFPPNTVYEVSGDGQFFICMPNARNQLTWGVNIHSDDELKEDWRTGMEDPKPILEGAPPINLGEKARRVIEKATEATRFGMYLRPVLQDWHKGRVVLIGDAAHPTTPFLGQGANQSTEDVYHLVRLLVKHQPLTTTSLEAALTEFMAIRLPRVSRTIDQTKREGATRIINEREALLEREAEQAKGLESETWKIILEMVRGPYEGSEAEI